MPQSLRAIATALTVLAIQCSTVAITAARAADIDILVEDDAAPWSRPDGTGYANDVVVAAFRAAGVEARLITIAYARCRNMVLTGSAAACFNMAWSPEYEGLLKFAERPLFTVFADVLESSSHPLRAESADAVRRGAVIGVVNGYEYPSVIESFPQRGVRLKSLRNEAAALQALAAGQVDAAVVMTHAFEPLGKTLADLGAPLTVTTAFRAGAQSSFLGFSTRHPQGLWAKEAFDRGFSLLASNGALEAIREKWFVKN